MQRTKRQTLWWRRVIKPVLCFFISLGLRFLPRAQARILIKRWPALAQCAPMGWSFLCDWYLGDVTIQINTLYPVERLIAGNRYDPSTLGVVAQLVAPGDFCLDIGANIGAISFALAKQVGPTGKVWACEPGKLPYERLCANIAANPQLAGIIVPFNQGFSDTEGTRFWKEAEDNRGNGSLLFSSQRGRIRSLQEGEGQHVNVTTIDQFFSSGCDGTCAFVKIDVECMEYEVIKGGMDTWRRHLPVLLYETMPICEVLRHDRVFEKIEGMLRGIGYRIFKFVSEATIVETCYPDLSTNTLAIPSEKEGLLARLLPPGR